MSINFEKYPERTGFNSPSVSRNSMSFSNKWYFLGGIWSSSWAGIVVGEVEFVSSSIRSGATWTFSYSLVSSTMTTSSELIAVGSYSSSAFYSASSANFGVISNSSLLLSTFALGVSPSIISKSSANSYCRERDGGSLTGWSSFWGLLLISCFASSEEEESSSSSSDFSLEVWDSDTFAGFIFSGVGLLLKGVSFFILD